MTATLHPVTDITAPATPSPRLIEETAALLAVIGWEPEETYRIFESPSVAAMVSEAMARTVEEPSRRILAALP